LVLTPCLALAPDITTSPCTQEPNVLHGTFPTVDPCLPQLSHSMSSKTSFDTSPDANDKIKVLIGMPPTTQTFILPKRELLFYSSYLRAPIERYGAAQPIILPSDDAATFEVLLSWVNYDTPSAKYQQQGLEFAKMVRVKDEEVMPLRYMVWVLAHRLEEPCLLLRDQCMRYLYEDHTRTVYMPGQESLEITPAITLYVMQNASNCNELRHFIFVCLARDGRQEADARSEKCTWDDVWQQLPWFKDLMPLEARSLRQLAQDGDIHVRAGRDRPRLVPQASRRSRHLKTGGLRADPEQPKDGDQGRR
jgi:hypothetical protein